MVIKKPLNQHTTNILLTYHQCILYFVRLHSCWCTGQLSADCWPEHPSDLIHHLKCRPNICLLGQEEKEYISFSWINILLALKNLFSQKNGWVKICLLDVLMPVKVERRKTLGFSVQRQLFNFVYFFFFSFDSLQPLQLLQVLNDVFAEINPQVIFVSHCFLLHDLYSLGLSVYS